MSMAIMFKILSEKRKFLNPVRVKGKITHYLCPCQISANQHTGQIARVRCQRFRALQGRDHILYKHFSFFPPFHEPTDTDI